MAGPARVELSVLGQKLVVRTDAGAEYLQSLARFVEDRALGIQQGGIRDPMSALTLAAIEIADELHRARDDGKRGAEDVSARLGALVDLLQSIEHS